MSNWSGNWVTRRGRELLAKVGKGGNKLEFTKMKLGDGTETLDAVDELNDLVGPKLTYGISSLAQSGNTCTIIGVVSSETVSEAFQVRENGLFAKDPDLGEILFAINLDNIPDTLISAGGSSAITIQYAQNLVFTNTTDVTAVIDPSGLVTTKVMTNAITTHNTAPDAHQELFAQIRQSLISHNAAPDAHPDIRQLCENAGVNLLRRSYAYAVGDIAYSKNLPSWARLECVRAGMTAASEPGGLASAAAGRLVTDGGVRWVVDDVRDGTPVGSVRGSLYLPPGYVKANGATVQRADYPRLVAWVQAHNLWTDDVVTNSGLFGRGDGAATFVLPNWVDRMVQFAANSAGAALAAGLPNITGTFVADGFGAQEGQDSGAFTSVYQRYSYTSSNTNAGVYKYTFDASKSNPIYGASNTVQPPAIRLMPIIRY